MTRKAITLPAAMLLLGLLTAAPSGGEEPLTPGSQAPGFTLKNVDGSMVSLRDYADEKGVILMFTCNHCPYVKRYEQRIQQLHERFAPKGYPVVCINPNDASEFPVDDFEGMVKRAGERGFTFAYLRDKSQEIAHAYGASHTPEVFLLQNQSGSDNFVVRYQGAIDNSPYDPAKADQFYLADAVTALLDGNEPAPKVTRAIGCTVKYRGS